MGNKVILVKHALPILDPSKPAKEWRLGKEGELLAKALAHQLEPFLPFALASSLEPKATKTSEIISLELGVQPLPVEGLEEIDRPALPILTSEQLACSNRRIFEDLTKPAIGQESGNQALTRFGSALRRAMVQLDEDRNLVVVSHGTVISLFVARRNDLDPFELWKRLECPSYVVLSSPSFKVIEVVGKMT